MASTSLFAPQVRAVQPAFTYPGGVKIYFSFSSFNDPSEINEIRYSLIDPNQASTWGTNSMLKEGISDSQTTEYYQIVTSWTKVGNTDEYYINLADSKFKTLTTNQFYQMQLWVKNKAGEVSAPSQVTLIRPILNHQVIIEGDGKSTYDLSVLKGSIEYINSNTVEALDTCYCQIGNYYKSSIVKCNGLNFEIPLNYNFKEGETYSGDFYYTTINGYSGVKEFSITLKAPGANGYKITSVKNDSTAAAIKLTYSAEVGAKVQRTSEETNFSSWKTIHTLTSETGDWKDYNVASGIQYQYRILTSDLSNGSSNSNIIQTDFEDIMLSDENTMVAIRYNPNISGLKYVVQESITNTLGSRYPIIRRNGDTKYKQFNLSGTIYIDCTEYDTYANNTSSNPLIDMSDFFIEDPSSLYLTDTSVVGFSNNQNQKILEREARNIVVDFLSNGKIKLLRSFEEGNMIVYLSGVSFTPNKQLDRHIYDFSATVTEVCEYNTANLKKYKLDKGGYIEFIRAINLSSNGAPVTEWEE